MFAQLKRPLIIFGIVFAILMIPYVAMRYTNEVNWETFDFLTMGSLLFGAGLAIDFVWRHVQRKPRRIAILIAIGLSFVLLWAELAVGIFGSSLAGS